MNHRNSLNKILSFAIAILTLMIGFGFLQATDFFQDAENRWQRFFYDVQQSLPDASSRSRYPIYLVELDDKSLPDGTCRSPVSKIWLNRILQALNRQSTKVIGLNLLLVDNSRPEDRQLKNTVKNLNNVVLLEPINNSAGDSFKEAARSWGSMSYRTNSAGDVQYVCTNPALCICQGPLGCDKQRIFFREIEKLLGRDKAEVSSVDGWLRLFFRFSPDHFRHTIGRKPWQVLSAEEVFHLPPESLQAGSLVLVGSGFKGLYQSYRISNQQLAASPAVSRHQQVSDLELVALVMDMVLSDIRFYAVPDSLQNLLLFVCFMVIAGLSWRSTSFTPIWLALLLSLAWNSAGALLFSYFQVEINCLLSSSAIILFGFFCIRYQQVEAKFERLVLENQLANERFNGLVDRFHSHSVFNALEHIRYLIRINAPEVENYLLDYSTLLLDDLRHNPQQKYPLKEQWDYIQNYLNLQNLKLKGKINIEFSENVASILRLQTVSLPWKLFYPLAENAFKQAKACLDHDVESSPRIRAELKVDEMALRFEISNSYLKRTQSVGTGQGLINLKKRLAILYPDRSWRLVQTTKDNDWNSSLTLPIEVK